MGGSMSSVVISGDTSGAITLAAPSVAGTNTITLPAVTGTTVIAGQNSAITAATAQASTSGTSIDFTSIPSWAKRITVMFNGVSTSGTSLWQVQIGAGSVDTTGYKSATGAQNVAGSALGLGTATTGFVVTVVVNAAQTSQGIITLVTLGSNIWVQNGIINNIDSTAYQNTSSGSKTLSGTLDRVRITTVNGTDTFDAGSINILYE
jgi:hypothetical protein